MNLSEGFGLSIIEVMHFVKLCFSFTDFDAYDDIYTPDVMAGVSANGDETVANGIVELLTRNRDSMKI